MPVIIINIGLMLIDIKREKKQVKQIIRSSRFNRNSLYNVFEEIRQKFSWSILYTYLYVYIVSLRYFIMSRTKSG